MAAVDEEIRAALIGSDQYALQDLIAKHKVTPDGGDVVVAALRRLQELDADGVSHLAIELSLDVASEIAHRVRHFYLFPWIRSEGYHHRDQVISILTSELFSSSGRRLEGVIRTLWVIGYRDDRIEHELSRLASSVQDDSSSWDIQGYAITALSSMCRSRRDEMSDLLLQKTVHQGFMTEADCWAAVNLAQPAMIPILIKARNGNRIAIHALLRLPLRYPGHTRDIWQAYTELSPAEQTMYVSVAADSVDLPDVEEHLLQRVLTALEHPDTVSSLPAADALVSSFLPTHLSYISTASSTISNDQIDRLRTASVAATRNPSIYQSTESLAKKAAWDVILRLGLNEAREWLPIAMSGERNFTLSELATIAGFLQVQEAAMPIRDALKDPSINLGVAVECLDALGVIGSDAALDVVLADLVRIKTDDGAFVPNNSVEAITRFCLSRKTCDTVWQFIQNPRANVEIRTACVFALEDLSTYVGSPLPPIDDFIRILSRRRNSIPQWQRLALCLSRHDGLHKVPEAISVFDELAVTGDYSPILNQALAAAGVLCNYPKRIERMGLIRREDGWYIRESLEVPNAIALLELYRLDESFEPAVVGLLDGGIIQLSIQITGNIRALDRVSDNVKDAILRHAVKRNGPTSSDLTSLLAVARVWPGALVNDQMVTRVSQWCGAARVGYLAALRISVLDERSDEIALLACRFLHDEDPSVRREAAWLAQDNSAGILRDEIDRLATRAESIDTAVFMLDAAFWLKLGWEEYAEIGWSHREAAVRDYTDRLSIERRAADLATTYVRRVISSTDYLATWSFGQAIIQIGNEETRRILLESMPDEIHGRAYHFWLAELLAKKLEEKAKQRAEAVILPPPNSETHPIEFTLSSSEKELARLIGTLTVSYKRRARNWVWSWSVNVDDVPKSLAFDLFGADRDSRFAIATKDGRKGIVAVGNVSATADDRPSSVQLVGIGELA